MHVLVFEDEQTEQLAPITTSRPAYSITCASFRLIDLLRRLDLPIAGHVRTHLKPLQTADFPDLVSIDAVVEKPETLLAINARAIPSKANDEAIQQLIASGKPGVVKCDDAVAAMLLSEQEVSNLNLGGESSDPANPIASLLEAASASNVLDTTISLFAWPHEVVREHMTLMNESLEHRLASGNYVQQQDGVFLAPGATLGEYAIVDTSEGPILLDSDVQVGPFCYLSGPVYAGPNTRVIEHSALKDGVTLGHTTKIGGEVEASIIEPYTNKQHHGFLGHSYLGSWINLGAGTCNSDLKNTYGKINIEYNGRRVPSEMQFLGCIVGDYSKTAINTGIFTGKVIGVCSMLYGFVTQNVASFMNYAQIFGQVAEIPPEVLIATQARMFARRKVQQRECDMQLIRDMYTATTHERERLNQIGTL